MELYQFYLILNEPELFEINKKFHFNLGLLKKWNKWDIHYMSIIDIGSQYNQGSFWDLVELKKDLINLKYRKMLYINEAINVNLEKIYPNSPAVDFKTHNWWRNSLINRWISPYSIEYSEEKRLLEIRLELLDIDLLEN